ARCRAAAGSPDRAAAVLAAASGVETGRPVSPEQAREEARHILAERRFHGTSLPRPLHGLFSWLARHLHFVARAWEWLAGRVGGVGVLWAIVGAVVLSLAVWFVSRLAQRRTEREESEVGRLAGGRGEDPA